MLLRRSQIYCQAVKVHWLPVDTDNLNIPVVVNNPDKRPAPLSRLLWRQLCRAALRLWGPQLIFLGAPCFLADLILTLTADLLFRDAFLTGGRVYPHPKIRPC